jgi:serralysin
MGRYPTILCLLEMKKFILFVTCLCLTVVWMGCSEKSAESSDTTIADSSYIEQNMPDESLNPVLRPPDSIKFCIDIPLIRFGKSGVEKAVGIDNGFWPAATKEIKVLFLDGDTAVIKKVMATANLWEPHSGIKFIQVNANSRACITVSFRANGTWSVIGRQALNKIPSMNLRGLASSSNDEEYRRVVLHEFGHALGLLHEHQNPISKPIPWDVKYVKNYLKEVYSPDEIERNIFKRYNKNSVNGTAYDAFSIMMYAIPAEFRLDRVATPWNVELSALDKSFIASKYRDNQGRLSR